MAPAFQKAADCIELEFQRDLPHGLYKAEIARNHRIDLVDLCQPLHLADLVARLPAVHEGGMTGCPLWT